MAPTRNTSHQPSDLVVFGFLKLPQQYETERDVIVNFVAVLCFFSVIINAIFLLTIIKDPFKKLRTITAILLGCNSAANLFSCLLLFINVLFYWAHRQLSPELIIYLGVFSATLYCICNFLHTVNIYGAIIVPVRYAVFEPKIRKVLVKFLSLIGLFILLVNIIPPYALPDNKVPSYVNAVLTLLFVQLVLLALIFGYLYTKIFQSLYSQRRKFTLSYHLKRSTVRGRAIKKKNHDIVKTLFIHVLCFMITTLPASVLFIVYLHCTTCDSVTLHLAGAFIYPLCFSTSIIHPLLWLLRLNNYKRAMKETLTSSFCFWRRRSDSCKISGSSVNLDKIPISASTKDFA